MKLILLAIVLLIGGIPNIFDSENMLAGILCTLIGIAIIAYRIKCAGNKSSGEDIYKSTTRQYGSERLNNSSNNQNAVQPSNQWSRNYDSYQAVVTKWKPIVDEHFRLSEQIGVAYTIANNLGLPDSPQMQQVIELCKKDIALAEQFKQSQIEIARECVKRGIWDGDDAENCIPLYPTFKRLAIIYEKQKKYKEAIEVCQAAINLGFVNDGTEGQMPGRIARLIRKQGKEALKISPVDQIIIEDNDE